MDELGHKAGWVAVAAGSGLNDRLGAMKDERLEALSDKVRMGIPIDFTEVLEAIEYQEQLKAERKKSIWDRFISWCRESA